MLRQEHRAKGDTLLIITATNRFVTEPIAARLNIFAKSTHDNDNEEKE